jgi:hypothetical protein
MTELPYKVGYGRPPVNTRFQKGKSGNPGGRRRGSQLLKERFEAALIEALNADEDVLRKVKPGKTIESFAFNMVLQAVDGRGVAQKLVLEFLDREAGVTVGTHDEEAGSSLAEEDCELSGDRYGEFKNRFDKALASGSTEDLLALAEDFEGAENSLVQGIPQGKFEKTARARQKTQSAPG